MSVARVVSARDRMRALQAAALCLNYPDQQLLDDLPLLARTASVLPSSAGAPLSRFVEHLASTEPMELARAYVATFDLQRRCCLHLAPLHPCVPSRGPHPLRRRTARPPRTRV